jgi:hypothetical protein
MSVAAEHGGFLFQLAPHLFPEGYMGGVELGLWAKFYEDRASYMKSMKKK